MPTASPPNIFLPDADWYFSEQGEGMPLVLVHAFPLNQLMWADQMKVGVSCRVLAPDLPGFGKTPAMSESFSIAGAAAALRSALAARGALPCVLGGCSMGGYVSLAFARAFPDDLRGLLLIDTRADGDSTEARGGREKTIELLRRSGPPAIADAMVAKLLSAESARHCPALVQQVRQMIESTSAEAIEAALLALRDRPDQTDLLTRITVPTMVIVGEQDVLTPPLLAGAMAAQLPNEMLRVIPGAGHLSPMEQPNQVNAAITELLHAVASAD